MLHHGKRDLPSLLRLLDAANQRSLELKRPLTLPMLREVMTREQPLTPSPTEPEEPPHESGAV